MLLICKFRPPDAGAEVWLTLACHAPEPWHPACVIGTSPIGFNRWQTRLAFSEPFPAHQLLSAVTGALPHERGRDRLDPPPRPPGADGILNAAGSEKT